MFNVRRRLLCGQLGGARFGVRALRRQQHRRVVGVGLQRSGDTRPEDDGGSLAEDAAGRRARPCGADGRCQPVGGAQNLLGVRRDHVSGQRDLEQAMEVDVVRTARSNCASP